MRSVITHHAVSSLRGVTRLGIEYKNWSGEVIKFFLVHYTFRKATGYRFS